MSRDKIAVVTGANSGLGFETAVGLAATGYEVVLACRDRSKAELAAERLRGRVGGAVTAVIELDLIDRDSIGRFAAAVSERYSKVDVLVNNAGVLAPPYTITDNGLELQFDANYVGHFLLTSLLLERLTRSPESRIISVSSLAAASDDADIHFDNVNFDGTYGDVPRWRPPGMSAYAQSKLANLLFAVELADRLAEAGSGIASIATHPGVSRTDVARHLPLPVRLLVPVVAPLVGISNAEDGARSIIFAATDPGVASGDYIGPTGGNERAGPPGVVQPPTKAADRALRRRLWEFTEELIGRPFAALGPD